MSIAAYCRVSSRHQKADGQIAEITKWLNAHGYDGGQVEWFVDKETGKTLKRPAFERLQQHIFAGKVSMVVVWKLDRLSPARQMIFCSWVRRFVLLPRYRVVRPAG